MILKVFSSSTMKSDYLKIFHRIPQVFSVSTNDFFNVVRYQQINCDLTLSKEMLPHAKSSQKLGDVRCDDCVGSLLLYPDTNNKIISL